MRRLFEGSMHGTSKQIVWDGKSQAGQKMPSGVYIYHLKAGEKEKVHRMVLIR
ncbi:hypothetical protein H8E88_01445 [candidate division KSB1 bacterium]|nr:hypothetical protein [candidate division KSB1 bacterium]